MAAQMQAKKPDPTKRELRMYRGGFSVFLIGYAVPYWVLIMVRYDLANSFVPPTLNQAWGIITTIVLLLSGWTSAYMVKAIRKGNQAAMGGYLRTTIVLGIISLITQGYSWATRGVGLQTHFGEIFVASIGASMLYTVLGLFVLLAMSSRAKRVGFTPGNHWDLEATNYFWLLTVFGWVAFWIAFYLI